MSGRLFSPKRAVAGPEPSSGEPSSEPAPSVSGLRKGREAGALMLFALAVFLCLALASLRVDPSDPSMTGPDWVGPVGAAVAGVLVRAFGLVAWLVPVELALLSAPLFTKRANQATALRLAGDLVVAIVLSALVQVMAPELLAFGRSPSGGNVGLLFGELMRAMFSTVGSLLVGLTVVGLILIGRSSFSFIQLCYKALALLRFLGEKAKLVGARLGDSWREARVVYRERRAAQAERAPQVTTKPSDEAILAHLAEDDADWAPLDDTGAPPLALSEQLRSNMRSRAELALLDEPLLAAPASERAAPDGASREGALVSSAPSPTPTLAEAVLLQADAGDFVSDTDETSRGRRAARGAGRSEARERAEEHPPSQAASVSDLSDAEAAPRLTPTPNPETGSSAKGTSGASKGSKSSSAKRASAEDSSDELDLAEASPAASGAAKASAEPTIVDTKPAQQVVRERRIAKRRAGAYELPSTELLAPPTDEVKDVDKDRVIKLAECLERTLADYGVTGKVEEIHPGPTVTTYELAPQAGTKVSKVAGLSDDLALGLSRKVRIIAPIPGKSRIGFELPNDERVPVNLRELIEDKRFAKLAEKAPLPVVLGRDIVGTPYYADLASMPHVIVAGATGAGKSVGLNVMLSSLLYHRSPSELRMLMIDPKVVELAPFDRIPHLLLPVVTDMKQAATALKWAVDEMERRYQLFASAGTKNISTYNRYVDRVQSGEIAPPQAEKVTAVTPEGDEVEIAAAKEGGDGAPLPDRLPFIVIVIDEFADLMMQQGKDVEAAVARLAQKARAAGMHVVLATQRPSVDVITGMIKANFPTRIAFRVAQKVDSRTILDEMGAEVLLGRGDMLVKMNGANDTRRVQCPFISEEEVDAIASHCRAQGEPAYQDEILKCAEEESEDGGAGEPLDSKYDEAVRIVAETQRCSTSWLQRKMTIGYNRAAKIVEQMEKQGIVGPPNGSKDREILISAH
ncbi:MAG: DNA translocase FtsK [Polyangiaceae bacterium]|nr:DNA translocase FtsK [Polyangiaceae bacterium]MCW5792233.1 DNA translocase FtsK [Polyangiaceae bacterium]